MKLTGGCLCGAVRFETHEQPQLIRHCHCDMCRKSSGSAFMTGLFYRADAVKWTGEAKSYESSPGILRYFCVTCGGSLAFRQAEAPEKDCLLLGTLDDPSRIEVNDNVEHVFAERELGWMRIDDTFPHTEGLPHGLVRIE